MDLLNFSLIKDYDVERDKSGRIVTGTQPGGQGQAGQSGRRDENRGAGGGRDRSRDDRGGEWNQANQSAGDWKYGNTYGLSAQFLESLGIEIGALISRVFVSNVRIAVHFNLMLL